MRRTFACVSLLFLSSSCSRLFPTDDARREIPITAPVVRIWPEHPTSSDTLLVVIVEPGVDPAGQHVEHTYAWSVDGAPRSGSPIVPGSLTAPKEVWTVEVTPRVGERAGTPRYASITIGEPAPITAPTIHVEPAEPRTLDDLRVVFDALSVDREDENVAYDFAWYRDGVPALTTTKVPHAQTTKGETWRVRVTPYAGNRVGESSEAEVTIRNTPPVVGTVGLSTYLPVTIDTLVAHPGAVSDPDGDEIAFSYAWVRNGGIPFLGHPLATLDLTARGFIADDSVGVTVTPSDDEGPGVSARIEGIRVHAARTGWRARTPNRMAPGGPPSTRTLWPDLQVAFDENDHRLIHLEPGAPWVVWEIPLDGPRRFARLAPEGTPPHELALDAQVIADPARDRLLVYHEGRVDALVLSRGNERWESVRPADGDAAEMRMFRVPVLFDEARNRLVRVMQGGVLEQVGLTGASAWSALSTTPIADRAGVSWLYERGADVAYLVGGLERSAPMPERWLVPSTQVIRVDLVTGETHTLDAPMPRPAVWSTTVTDPRRRRGYVIEGASEGEHRVGLHDGGAYTDLSVTTWSGSVLAFDFASETWTLVTDEPGPVPPRAFGSAIWDPRAEHIMMTTGYHGRFRSDLVVVHPNGTRSTYDAIGHETPPALCDGRVIYGTTAGTVVVELTSDALDAPVDIAWVFDATTGALKRRPISGDPSHGYPRQGGSFYGAGRLTSNTFTSSVVLNGDLDDDLYDLWFLDSQAWAWHRAAEDVLPPTGAVQLLAPSSADDGWYVFGGGFEPDARMRAFHVALDGVSSNVLAHGVVAPSAMASVFVNTRLALSEIHALDVEGGMLSLWATARNPVQTSSWQQVWVDVAEGSVLPTPESTGFPGPVFPRAPGDGINALMLGPKIVALRSHATWTFEWEVLDVAQGGAYTRPPSGCTYVNAERILAIGGREAAPFGGTRQTNATWELELIP